MSNTNDPNSPEYREEHENWLVRHDAKEMIRELGAHLVIAAEDLKKNPKDEKALTLIKDAVEAVTPVIIRLVDLKKVQVNAGSAGEIQNWVAGRFIGGQAPYGHVFANAIAAEERKGNLVLTLETVDLSKQGV